MRVTDVHLGPWPNGLDNVNGSGYEQGFTPTAVNTVFSNSGEALAIRGFGPASASEPDALLEHGSIINSNLVLPDATTLTSGFNGPIYSDFYGSEVVSGGSRMAITYPEPRVLLRLPPVATVTPLAIGSLSERTGVMLGMDGIFSVPQYVTSKGLRVDGPEGAGIYITRPDGKDFYRVGTMGTSGKAEIYSSEYGSVLPDRATRTRPIPLRGPITLNTSRLFSAIGSSVYYSEPYVFNASTPMSFYQFPGKVMMVAGIDKHLFVGTRSGVWFVSNAGSDKGASVKKVSSSGVLSHSIVRPSAQELGIPAEEVVAWMSVDGLQLGSADGSVITPGAGKVRFDGPVDGVLAYHQKRFFYYKRG